MVSLTADGPLSMKETDTLNGTVTEHDALSVTPDGKTMTIEVLHRRCAEAGLRLRKTVSGTAALTSDSLGRDV